MKDQPAASSRGTRMNISQSDIRALVRGELTELQKEIKKSVSGTKDTMMKYHLEDALVRIDNILDPK
jgi:hypothetical protein